MSSQDQAVVIGGGIAGVSTALCLADNGYQVHIIEKKGGIGGHAMQFCCKATAQCNSCGVCVAKDKVMLAASHPNIHILTYTEVVNVQGESPEFQLEVRKSPRFIDENKCIACSLCYQNCPKASEAIERPYPSPLTGVFSIKKQGCLHFQKGMECRICQELCPTGAIFFDQQEEHIRLRASAIILATGYEVYDAREKGYLGYGRFPEVLSGEDLEQRLLVGGERIVPEPCAEKRPSVAFIQCVGSRDPHTGHDYCSRVCCKYATRMAAKIKSKYDEINMTIFYIDLQKTERGFLEQVESLQDDIHFIKGLPVEIEKAKGPGVSMRYENIDQGCMEKADFDLVILSVGICPRPENRSLAELLGVSIAGNGFFESPDLMDSTVSSRRGIFLAGTCQGPKNIIETISHGHEAALRTLALCKGLEGTQ